MTGEAQILAVLHEGIKQDVLDEHLAWFERRAAHFTRHNIPFSDAAEMEGWYQKFGLQARELANRHIAEFELSPAFTKLRRHDRRNLKRTLARFRASTERYRSAYEQFARAFDGLLRAKDEREIADEFSDFLGIEGADFG